MESAMVDPEVLVEKDALVGEGAIWDEGTQQLYWVDILSHEVYVYDPVRATNRAIPTCQAVGTVVVRKRGGLVVALHNGFAHLDLETEKITPLGEDPERSIPTNRFNDGKCDNRGRFYAGTMNEFNLKPTGCFYILYGDLSYKKIDEGFVITNGPAFSPDYKKIYLTDSVNGKIFVSSIKGDGTLKNKKIFISIPSEQGKPDGMTVDEDGFLWVSLFGGSRVNRYNVYGEKVDEIKLPATCITSCTFGGKDLKTLFITSSRFKLKVEEKRKEPLAGSLFSVKLKVKGKKTNKFKFLKNNIF